MDIRVTKQTTLQSLSSTIQSSGVYSSGLFISEVSVRSPRNLFIFIM